MNKYLQRLNDVIQVEATTSSIADFLVTHKPFKNLYSFVQNEELSSNAIDEEVLYWVVFELSMCINFLIGKFNTYIKDYMRFIKDAPVVYFSNHIIRHRFKSIYLIYLFLF